MFRLGWMQERGATRETLRRDQTRRRRWPGIGLLVCLAFLQSGCQSGPSCGGCSGLIQPLWFLQSRLQSRYDAEHPQRRLLRPDNRFRRPYRGWSVLKARSYANDSAIFKRNGTLDDLASSDRLARNPGRDSEGQTGPPPSGGASNSSNSSSRTTYQTRRPVPGSGIPRVIETRTWPGRWPRRLSRPRGRPRRLRNEVAPEVSGSDNQDPLDHLPPLDLPGEVTRSNASPTPALTSARPTRCRGKTERSLPEQTRGESRKFYLHQRGCSSRGADASGRALKLGQHWAGTDSLRRRRPEARGWRRPSAAGLQWLVEKGYRTLLDLREPSEVPSSFIAEVTNKGLRYIALPVSLTSINRDRVDRFHFEVAGEARPLFFLIPTARVCAQLGTSAGSWSIASIRRLRTVKPRNSGLVDSTAWLATTDYVARFASPRAGTSTSEARSGSAASPGPAPGITSGQTAPESLPGSTAAAQTTSSQLEPKSAGVATGTASVTLTPPSVSLAHGLKPGPGVVSILLFIQPSVPQ